ncbi:Endonuclease/exonuclease/phosphatase [Schizothecium vesticola]|uniref:DNA-(apurinic or apyrimidinic site) endonuclease 2 n=1 Tax=Schizothecium vesticola TaxID=314040 RepID=A0AA40F9F4_9PEZI|nr:Endonuclease/exonuclease/phosphatase [Schizothecium vesticola]
MGLRITTWNVNGIRNPFGYQPWRESRTFQAMFDTLEADIVVMQETKIQRKDLSDDMVLVPGWDVFFSLPKYKKGYSGVAIYTRTSKCCPIRAEEGITGVLCPRNSATRFRERPVDQQIGGYPRADQIPASLDEASLDAEGRCMILEFPAFVLLGVYSPASRDETRTEFRQAFLNLLDIRVRNLVAMGKQVVLVGDLNIIRSELDTAGLQERLRKEALSLIDFFSSPSRRFLNQLVFGGQVVGERDAERQQPVLWDLCREFHPERKGMYTCWETKKNARPGNFGSRIDYVLCSAGIKDWFVDANIQEGLLGSDHCPVYAMLGDAVHREGQSMHIADIMNPEGMFQNGERLREWMPKDLLPLSAKLIPEFDKRQSIRDMFFKKATPAAKQDSPPVASGSGQAIPFEEEDDVRVSGTDAWGQRTSVSASQLSTDTYFPSSLPSTQSPRKPSPPKRPAEYPGPANRPQKKSKATRGKDSSAKSGPAQSSLMGFFKPKAAESSAGNGPGRSNEGSSPFRKNASLPAALKPTFGEDSVERVPPTDADAEDAMVHDPIVAKESWSKLLGKRVVPKCEHDEDCKSQVTRKPGVNCGRSFFACARPLGPSGAKEINTEFRCGTFIWSSDWNGRQ